jgi:hypothetical protein
MDGPPVESTSRPFNHCSTGTFSANFVDGGNIRFRRQREAAVAQKKGVGDVMRCTLQVDQ